MTVTTVLSVWPEDERDRKRSPARCQAVFCQTGNIFQTAVNASAACSVDQTKGLSTMMNTIFSIWPEDERDRKRAPARI